MHGPLRQAVQRHHVPSGAVVADQNMFLLGYPLLVQPCDSHPQNCLEGYSKPGSSATVRSLSLDTICFSSLQDLSRVASNFFDMSAHCPAP